MTTVIEPVDDDALIETRSPETELGLKAIFVGVAAYMLWVTIDTSRKRNLFKDLPRLNREPWFVATIKDYYLNILLFSLWTTYKERSLKARLAWIAAFCGLGSIATSTYALKQLIDLKPGERLESMLLRRDEGELE